MFQHFSPIFLTFLLFISTSLNGQDNLSVTDLNKQLPKSMTKLAAPTSTSYTSVYFNVQFTCPTGWTITAFDSNTTSATLTVSKSLRNNVYIICNRHASAELATRWDKAEMFGMTKIAANADNTYMPGVYNIFDSIYTASNYHTSTISLKYGRDASLNYTQFAFDASESRSIYQHEIYYFTSVSDYNTNGTDYYQNWLNIFFNSATALQPAAKSSGGITINRGFVSIDPSIRQLKMDLFNIMGGKITDVYDSKKQNQLTIPFDQFLKSKEPSILKATTPSGSQYFMINSSK